MKIETEITKQKKNDNFQWLRIRIPRKTSKRLTELKKSTKVSKNAIIHALLDTALNDETFVLKIKK